MKLKHTFVNEPSAITLFDGTNNLEEFIVKLDDLSVSLPKANIDWRHHADPNLNRTEVLGAGFELFCECLSSIQGFAREIGLTEYEPVNANNDLGVDAYAKNPSLQKTSVQCKFCLSPVFELSTQNSNIESFVCESGFNGIDYFIPCQDKKLVVITTGQGLNHHTADVKFQGCIRVINRKMLARVTNNVAFWTQCVKLIKESNEQV
jgi:hypothetical protein